ncbi:ABC transporter substrate-binding protein [Tianweitania sediminis]|uniref:ABC transporter substrate-binding protein n=1 Tax=Tianweitania sediminis TaxID=1502156 RepID=A0A8J7R582_9HYPH|nr:ABC transporter substrate-binding protein [Tianweitania sediminis]MBP0440050.1 ABC transporter substrate-binding protein [Tianweitania sediminis]
MKNGSISRRDLLRASANLGIASFALSLGATSVATAQEKRVVLGHFASANQQNYAKATGSMQAAMGSDVAVDFVGVSAGPQILTAMAADSMDLCNMGSSPMLVGFAQGLPVSMVYVHKIVKDGEALVVREGSGISTLEDLKGRKIGCPFNTSVHFALIAALQSVNLTPADVELINLRPDATLAAWQQNAIDAAYIWHPVLGTLQSEGGSVIFETGDLASQGILIFDAIVCRNAFKEEHPDLVLAYLKELARINEIYRSKPEEIADTMAPFLQIPRETALLVARTTHTITPEEMLTSEWLGQPGSDESGVITALKKQVQFMVDTGQMPNPPSNLAKFIDSSFVQKMVS